MMYRLNHLGGGLTAKGADLEAAYISDLNFMLK